MQPKPVRVAILTRVSTKKQDTDRQRNELLAVAAERRWDVVRVIEETVTGTADLDDRPDLQQAVDLAEKGKIDKVLVHEVTRIARRPSVIHWFIEQIHKHKVSLYWHSQGMETLTPKGERAQCAAIMISILSGLAENETDVLKERIRSGLAEARRKGVRLGRPPGRMAPEKLREKHAANLALLAGNMHLSVKQQAKLTGLSTGTVMTLRKLNAARS